MRRDEEAAAQRWAVIVTGAAVLGFLLVGALAQTAVPEEDFSAWPEHRRQFGSTGGGGVVIGAYDPVVRGALCTTDFTATLADGTVLRNAAEFDAVPAQGGTLCTNGRWRSLENDARGTTPYRVFFRDGVVRGWPQ